jgi:hypothetical protein
MTVSAPQRRRVADVRVDLHEEVAPDDHRLELGMVDVGREDGSTPGDLIADKLRGDGFRNRSAPALAWMLAAEFPLMLEPMALPDRHELHLGRDLAASGVVHLSDSPFRSRTQRRPGALEAHAGQLWIACACACVLRGEIVQRLHVGSSQDPRHPDRGEPEADVEVDLRVAVRTRGVVGDDRRILFRNGPAGRSEHRRRRLPDLAHRDPNRGS